MKQALSNTQQRSKSVRVLAGAAALGAVGLTAAAPVAAQALQDGRIAYVMTERRWAVYETEDGKAECPQGFNLGPREQFDVAFPASSRKVYTEMETRLAREGAAFHDATDKDPFPFHEARGPISYGLNLDGKVGPNDFESPTGVKGVDNQLYRAIGCIGAYRMGGVVSFFDTDDMYGNAYNRWIIELSSVDDLQNDDDVTVTTYRGLDDLQRDGTGMAFAPGATQEIDMRWGKSFISELKGRIKDGVLITDPIDWLKWPNSQPGVASGYYMIRDARFELDLTAEVAKGFVGGYADINSFSHQLNTNWATHHQSYGQLAASSLHKALRRLADAHPDPETGKNTAISSAIELTFTQVYLVRPEEPSTTTASR